MRVFANKRGTLTAVIGCTVLEVETPDPEIIAEAWGLDAGRGEFDKPVRAHVLARRSIEALLKIAPRRIGSRTELEMRDDERLRVK
jgi:hypothetical protein